MSQTAKAVEGYLAGKPFDLLADEVEAGKVLSIVLVDQSRQALGELRAQGISVTISSAFRTMEEQTFLYEQWKAGVKGFNPADPPGYSKHQQGIAWDLHFPAGGDAREAAAAILSEYGFSRPHAHEPWHFEGTPLPATPAPYPLKALTEGES